MTPDELRALADEMQSNIDEARIILRGKITVEDKAWFAMHDKAIDYLRACADAKPVPAGWKLVPVEPTPEMLQAGASIMDFDRSGWYDADVSRAEYRAMLAAAPAAPQAGPKCGCRACLSPAELMTTFVVCPKCGNKRCPKADDHRYACTGSNAPGQTPQAEPIDPHMIVAEDRFPDAQAEPKRELTADERDMMDSALRSSVKLVARGVAEPKREPLSEEQMRAVLIAEARWIAAQAGEKDPDSLPVDEEMLAQVMLAGRAVERAHGIGGSDE